jgi:ubiquinone biosynthesis protein COQ4
VDAIYIVVSTKEVSLMARTPVLPRFDIPRAGRALSTLMANPDDLPQVFTLIESLSGTAPHRLLLGFKLSKHGRRLLRERPDIAPILADRDGLRALPDGSLGRAYLAFVEAEGISPAGIRAASLEGMSGGPRLASFEYLHMRMRDTHDVWHAATGYKGDVLGELALLAFTLGQHWNTGVAFIVFAGLLKGLGRGEWRLLLDGHRRGRAAAWLPAEDWESLLPLPLAEVRARLSLGAPAEYTPVRTAELRAEGVLA